MLVNNWTFPKQNSFFSFPSQGKKDCKGLVAFPNASLRADLKASNIHTPLQANTPLSSVGLPDLK